MLKEFKEFAMRGNVMDMAIGIIIGGAFGKIVSSLVGDVIMPVVGSLTSGVDFTQMAYTLGEGDNAAEIKYGTFVQTVFDFIIVAFAIFIMVKIMNSAKKKEEAAPAKPPAQEVLLTEIRDLLKKG